MLNYINCMTSKENKCHTFWIRVYFPESCSFNVVLCTLISFIKSFENGTTMLLNFIHVTDGWMGRINNQKRAKVMQSRSKGTKQKQTSSMLKVRDREDRSLFIFYEGQRADRCEINTFTERQ